MSVDEGFYSFYISFSIRSIIVYMQTYDKARNALALALSPVVKALVNPDGAMIDIRNLDSVRCYQFIFIFGFNSFWETMLLVSTLQEDFDFSILSSLFINIFCKYLCCISYEVKLIDFFVINLYFTD